MEQSQQPEAKTTSTSSLTRSVTTWPFIGCFKAADEQLGAGRIWKPIKDNAAQEEFVSNFLEPGRQELSSGRFDPEELKFICSQSAAEINNFLVENGFPRLANMELGPLSLGLASVLRIVVKWKLKGSRTKLERGGYDAVYLGKEKAEICSSPENPHPVAALETQSGDRVYLTVLDNPPTGFELVRKAKSISDSLSKRLNYEGVIFPMIDLDHQVDASWVIGMHTTDEGQRPLAIQEASQQTRLKMNHIGALAESAVTMGVLAGKKCDPTPPLIIDRPFLFWIMRKGLSQPLFAAVLDKDVWKDPGEIDF